MPVPQPNDEAARLDSLRACRILDTPSEAAFERIADLAAQILDVPLAAVSFVDRDRQWFKARVGLPVCETSRESSFCAHAILDDGVLVVPDATADPRFADNPFVTGEPGVRFYAGAPLRAPDGQALGALCVFDRRPRDLDGRQRRVLSDLAALVIDEVSLRTEVAARQQAESDRARRSEIHQRQLADRELRRSEHRFRQLFNQAGDAAMVHDLNGRLVDVNDAACASLGYSRAELLTMGVPDFELTHDPAEGSRFWRELPVGSVEKLEGRHRRKDSSTFPVEIHVSVLETDEGRHLLALIRDTTERKRTEELLRAAKEEAEKANRAKTVFLSRMSHELRTPLNAILGFGQLLELSALNTQDAMALGYILKGGRNLLALVDEVLDLSCVETGDLHLSRENVNVGALARECVDLVARLALSRRVACRVSVPPEASLWMDAQRLRQMLLNLLSNAIKYNREGGDVLVSSEETPGRGLRLKVSDTGPGIPPEGLTRLFVPFERLDQEFGETEGTGLGLVISRRIAEAMGGSLGVESTVGQGSTFWIELPRAAPPPPPAPLTAAVPAEPSAVRAAAAAPNATLLYIEDNHSNLQVVKALLANCRPHWQFLSAKNGRDGLEQARQHTPGLILLDLQLPGMKGDAVLAELRRDPRTRNLPVVLLSADATAHSRERLLALGADDYLSKPFQVDALLALLDRTLLNTAVTIKPPAFP